MHKKHTILLIFVLTGLLASFGLSVHADSDSLACCGTDPQLVEEMHMQLVQKKLAELNREYGQSDGDISLYAAIPGRDAFRDVLYPSTGNVHALVIPITFPGYTDDLTMRERINDELFGTHEDQDPFELTSNVSAREIFAVNSNGKLNFTGDVMPIYEAEQLPAYYNENDPHLTGLLNDAIDYHQSTGALSDCSKYDSNNDGDVDCLVLLAPDFSDLHHIWYSDATDYRQTWVDSMRSGKDEVFIDGNLEAERWIFCNYYNVEGREEYITAETLVHEYGHVMGMDDHYTSKNVTDKAALIGRIDIMGEAGRHFNPYYRYLLDWIEPEVLPYEEGLKEIELCAYENSGDTDLERAVIFIPDAKSLPYTEFYMAEYRSTLQPTFEDVYYSGVMLWHVNAAVKDNILQFANPTSFIAPVYKDGTQTGRLLFDDQIHTVFNASKDLYLPGDVFSAESSPSSDFYDGSHTGAYLEVLSMDEEKAVIKAGFVEPDVRPRPTLTLGEVTDKIVDISSGITIPLKYENFDSIEKLNCEWITTGTAKVLSTSKVDEETGEGYIQISSTSGDGTCQLKILPGCAKNGNMYEPYGALSEVFIVDNTPPEITVSYSTTQKTNRPVAVTYTANEDVRETPTRSKTIYARSNAKLMSAQLTDLAGNKGRCSYSIDWIVPDDYVYFTQEENVITAMPVFAKSGTPALNEMLGYAAYKKNGKLMHLEPLTFGRHPTTNILGANFTLLPQYEDCQVEVFVWNRNMKPYFAAEKVT